MHARLKIGRPEAPMVLGGWYPVVQVQDYLVGVSVDGRHYDVGMTFLELSEAPRERAAWGFPESRTASMPMAVVVCPAGHHILDVGAGAAAVPVRAVWAGLRDRSMSVDPGVVAIAGIAGTLLGTVLGL